VTAPGAPAAGPPAAGLRLLAIDDEPPALSELAFLLSRDPRVASVSTAADGPAALRVLQDEPVDAVFLDIRIPGLDGLDLARVLARFAAPPPVVFVTAYDDHAVDAFELHAVDYVLKPVREERLAEAVRRVAAALGTGDATVTAPTADETIAVELGGVTRFVQRSDVRFVEAQGDYARLHTSTGGHLVRVALSTLEERWAEAGFVRIHRRYLVAIPHIEQVRTESGRTTVCLPGGTELVVARRHSRELRDRLVRSARPDRSTRSPGTNLPDGP